MGLARVHQDCAMTRLALALFLATLAVIMTVPGFDDGPQGTVAYKNGTAYVQEGRLVE